MRDPGQRPAAPLPGHLQPVEAQGAALEAKKTGKTLFVLCYKLLGKKAGFALNKKVVNAKCFVLKSAKRLSLRSRRQIPFPASCP
jgi:hypothetical protein